MKNEIISFNDVATLTVLWNSERKGKFGDAAVMDVYILNEENEPVKTTVEVKPDLINTPTKYDFDFGGVSTGAIIIT
jgi:hypothetical protein